MPTTKRPFASWGGGCETQFDDDVDDDDDGDDDDDDDDEDDENEKWKIGKREYGEEKSCSPC